METKQGSFCWLELGTTNRDAARTFYASLFGWEANDIPMGPGMSYTLFRLGGKDVSGAYDLMADQLAARVPPHWMPYIKVDSADASASKAIRLGAKQILAPSDIPHVGRFAVIQDVTGAMISIFQTGEHQGMQTFGAVGALCWADLNTPDPARAAQFYGD